MARPHAWSEKLARLWLSGLGTGYLPLIPATWGTLPAVPLAWVAAFLPFWGALMLFVGALGLSLWSHRLIQPLPEADPRWFVADEMVAFILVSVLYPLSTLAHLGVAFVLFRFWDIVKLWPADALEALPEPWGVLADDMIAAIYTWGCLLLIGL